ncbi:MAG: hypothetical protein QHJ73_07425 [Armatimonadota bacterium]|nr:hypothetical protein [Armatimonadota bacterium]
MSEALIAARCSFPVVELTPIAARGGESVEEMVSGPFNNHPDITSAHFPRCVASSATGGEVRLLLVKPVDDRGRAAPDEVLQRLDEAGFVPEELASLALLKAHADALWNAGIYYILALGPHSVWEGPDGRYAVYFIANPADRGFSLYWLEGDIGGHMWLLVRRRELPTAGT